MDIKTIDTFDKAREKTLPGFAKLSLALLFMVVVFLWSYTSHGNVPNNPFLIIGAVFGAYMAMNIGANDVANAMGTSVGSGAITFKQAVIIAVIFEFAGAVLAGGEVTATVRKGILDAGAFTSNPELLVYGMLASLLAAATWLLIASSLGWPVSTTHSIVGAIVGFGAVGVGVEAVSWGKVYAIIASWVVSPGAKLCPKTWEVNKKSITKRLYNRIYKYGIALNLKQVIYNIIQKFIKLE